MTKKHKVYLPPVARWFVLTIVSLVWVLIAYLEFFNPVISPDKKLGPVGFIIISAILLLVAIMIWLMSTGKIPAYLIEEED